MTAPLKLPAEIEAAMDAFDGAAYNDSVRPTPRTRLRKSDAREALRSAVLKYGDERYDRGNRDGMGLV